MTALLRIPETIHFIKHITRRRAQVAALFNSALDFVFPPSCAWYSGMVTAIGQVLCTTCGKRIRPGEESIPQAISQSGHLDRIITAARFDEMSQQLIHRLKYQRKKHVGLFLGKTIGKIIENDERTAHIRMLVPVPLHKTRLRERGYNQSQLIAQGIAAITSIPVYEDLIERTRNTPSQTTLSSVERVANMRNVFQVVDSESVKILDIALVDDVLTTGATLDSCARALRQAGATSVCALTFAHA